MAVNPKRMRMFNVQKVELKVNFIQRWSITSQYDKVHAMQFKESFLYFGAVRNNLQGTLLRNDCTVCGFSAIPIDDESNYLWFPLPCTSTCTCDILNNVVTYEHGIQFKFNQDVLTLNLMDPSQQWRGMIQKNRTQVPNVFNAFQKYRIEVQTKIHSNTSHMQITIINKQNEHCTGHYIYQLPYTYECINCTCAMIKDDLYIIIKDKMIVMQKLDQKIVKCEGDNNLSSDFEIAVPHSSSTPFVVQDVLFIVGGHDSHHEPFPDIYQFDHDTMSWQMYGRTTVSRYGAKVVVFKGRNEKESVFIVGGFRQSNVPCGVIERIPVELS